MIDTQETMTTSQFVLSQVAIYLPFIAAMIWIVRGKNIRRWWRRRKLTIPKENEVKTIHGPLWDVSWIRVSEATEKHPEVLRTTVLGHTLPEVFAVLKARYGDDFDEKNVRSTSKQTYTDVLVGLPEKEGQ